MVTAIECAEFGPIENLRVVEREPVPLAAGQVRLAVSATGVNFVDGLFVEGRYQIKPPTPFVPGGEVVGRITELGAEVADGVGALAVGQRVFANLGLGGFAMGASPAITQFVGGTPDDAIAATRSMRRITMSRHPAFPLPPLNFVGTPSGIDVLKVLDTGVLPLINTGIAHKLAGVGQIGAGIAIAPPDVFLKAARALASARGIS